MAQEWQELECTGEWPRLLVPNLYLPTWVLEGETPILAKSGRFHPIPALVGPSPSSRLTVIQGPHTPWPCLPIITQPPSLCRSPRPLWPPSPTQALSSPSLRSSSGPLGHPARAGPPSHPTPQDSGYRHSHDLTITARPGRWPGARDPPKSASPRDEHEPGRAGTCHSNNLHPFEPTPMETACPTPDLQLPGRLTSPPYKVEFWVPSTTDAICQPDTYQVYPSLPLLGSAELSQHRKSPLSPLPAPDLSAMLHSDSHRGDDGGRGGGEVMEVRTWPWLLWSS